ncbi:hypothetical protein GJ496_009316 [Pomphorhynchus laevis]|nr:hypothetical protein GJ496_009316 [Pomphorhynchus laevis]
MMTKRYLIHQSDQSNIAIMSNSLTKAIQIITCKKTTRWKTKLYLIKQKTQSNLVIMLNSLTKAIRIIMPIKTTRKKRNKRKSTSKTRTCSNSFPADLPENGL